MLTIRFRIEVALFRLLLAMTRLVPRRAMLALGSLLGEAGFALNRRHRRITMQNLNRALGLERRRLRRTARACWRHFGRVMLDTLYFPRLDEESIGDWIEIEGEQHLRAALEGGKGALAFTAHFGHWELAAIAAGFRGFPVAVIARPLSNPGLEPVLRRLRSVSGNRIIYKHNAVREILKALAAGECVAILIDQDARERGIFVPFFDRPAATTPTLASLALRTGAPVLPVFCVPVANRRYRLVIEPEVEVRSTGDDAADVSRITARCTSILEGWVRRRPELWLWMHRRWKTRPNPVAGRGTGAEGPG